MQSPQDKDVRRQEKIGTKEDKRKYAKLVLKFGLYFNENENLKNNILSILK